MPFIATAAGTTLTPEEAIRGHDLHCPDCGDSLYVRESHTRGDAFVARHFVHTSGGDDCGGESDLHRKCKSIALSKAKQTFDHDTADVEVEVGDHIADAVIKFTDPVYPLGRGLAIEVQHKHKNKDIDIANQCYVNHEYSVCWLDTRQFDGHDVTLSDGDFHMVWPNAVPDPKPELYPNLNQFEAQSEVLATLHLKEWLADERDIYRKTGSYQASEEILRYLSQLKDAWNRGKRLRKAVRKENVEGNRDRTTRQRRCQPQDDTAKQQIEAADRVECKCGVAFFEYQPFEDHTLHHHDTTVENCIAELTTF